MASLRKRGKNYYCYWREGGKHYQKSVGPDLRFARIKQGEIEKRIIDKKSGQHRSIPWDEFTRKFLTFSEPNVAKDTIVRIKVVFNNINKTIKIRMLSDLTPELLEEYKLARKNDGIQGSTINRELTTIKTALKQAVEWGYASSNVWGVRKMPEVKKHPVFFTEQDLCAMLKVSDPYWKAVIHLGVYAGLRRGEMLHLTWDDVDFDRGVIRVAPNEDWHPKDREAREIPIHPALEEYLKDWKKLFDKKESNNVIPWVGKHNIFSRNFSRILHRAELEKGSLHTLRHSFASHLAMRGVDLLRIGQMMGHSSVTTTQLYAHLLPSSLKEAVLNIPFMNSKNKPHINGSSSEVGESPCKIEAELVVENSI